MSCLLPDARSHSPRLARLARGQRPKEWHGLFKNASGATAAAAPVSAASLRPGLARRRSQAEWLFQSVLLYFGQSSPGWAGEGNGGLAVLRVGHPWLSEIAPAGS